MARPVRLRYVDSNGDTQIIGESGTDSAVGDIDGLELKNSGSGEYTHVELTGNKNLIDNMPVNVNDFNNSNEPEIFLDVWSTSSDSWVTRDRVFAENPGKIESDRGKYRNEQIFGFQKWVGRQRVSGIGPINSDVAGVVSAALNNVAGNYTVQTNGTIPSVTNYTFTGRIDSLIRDIIRDYPSITVYWTSDTSSGNYVVKVEEKGAGSTVETLTYPDPNYQLIGYEPEDTSTIINRVVVKGTDSNGNKITFDTDSIGGSLGTDISNSKDKYGETAVDRNIGYLQDSSHAESIAKNILQLDAKPHLKIAIPFQEKNVLNASVDITDDRYGINGVYKVVKQRDFFKDSRTEVELSFEKNRAESRRNQDRDVGEERARLYPDSSTDVGQQSLNVGRANAQVSSSSSNDYDNGKAQVSSSSSNDYDNGQAQTSSSTSLDKEQVSDFTSEEQSDSFFDENIDDSQWHFLVETPSVSTDSPYHMFIFQITNDQPTIFDGHFVIAVSQGRSLVHITGQNIGEYDSSNVNNTAGRLWFKHRAIRNVEEYSNASSVSYQAYARTLGTSSQIDGDLRVQRVQHVHGASTSTSDSGHGGEGQPGDHNVTTSTSTSDSGHGGKGQAGDHNVTTSTSTSDSGHGDSNTDPHGGDTDAKNIDITVEDKTDR